MTIDPDKLIELARARQRDNGVPLSWTTVIKIADELRRLQGYVNAPQQAAALREYAHHLHPDHVCREHLLREAARLTREAEGIRQ